MSVNARDDVVAQQYKKWQYPKPVRDLEAFVASGWERFDPSKEHRALWPDRPYRADLDILSAGCGTNQAPVLAYTNPSAKVVAIDISQESIEHGRFLKDKYGLRNLEFHLLPIEEVGTLGHSFDEIICTGVLHHMASPEAGMKALADVLRPDGVAGIMLYARYGRIGVEIMQSVFRDMGLRQDEESLRMVREGLNSLDPSHPARAYVASASDLGYDAGMVDTFLHGRDISFTVDDCLALVEGAGLVFQDWLVKASMYPLTLLEPDNDFYAAIARMPERQMWAVMERVLNLNGRHIFTACRTERPEASYRIDFDAANALDYVPVWRHEAGVNDQGVYKFRAELGLSGSYWHLAHQVDGQRSIREITQQIVGSEVLGVVDKFELESVARELFKQLWRLDFLAIDLSTAVAD